MWCRGPSGPRGILRRSHSWLSAGSPGGEARVPRPEAGFVTASGSANSRLCLAVAALRWPACTPCMAVGADGRLRPGVCGLDHALAAAIREYASVRPVGRGLKANRGTSARKRRSARTHPCPQPPSWDVVSCPAQGDSLSASSFLRVWEQRSLRLLHVLLDDAADPHSRLIRYCDAYACALGEGGGGAPTQGARCESSACMRRARLGEPRLLRGPSRHGPMRLFASQRRSTARRALPSQFTRACRPGQRQAASGSSPCPCAWAVSWPLPRSRSRSRGRTRDAGQRRSASGLQRCVACDRHARRPYLAPLRRTLRVGAWRRLPRCLRCSVRSRR